MNNPKNPLDYRCLRIVVAVALNKTLTEPIVSSYRTIRGEQHVVIIITQKSIHSSSLFLNNWCIKIEEIPLYEDILLHSINVFNDYYWVE